MLVFTVETLVQLLCPFCVYWRIYRVAEALAFQVREADPFPGLPERPRGVGGGFPDGGETLHEPFV
jgi:hypothetical protein